MKQNSSFLILLICLFSACTEDEKPVQNTDLGYNFFPTNIGSYIIYKADSIYHDHPQFNAPGIHDTSSYFIKEVLESEFEDAQGRNSVRIERFKKDTETEPWQLRDVWYATRNANNAEKVEENVRYVKMGFPITNFREWDGNALNHLEAWIFIYDSLYIPKNLNGLAFAKSVQVQQRNFLTAVNDEYAYEIYAEDVGLIYRYQKVLFTRPSYLNNRVASNIISGSEFTWKVIDYGME